MIPLPGLFGLGDYAGKVPKHVEERAEDLRKIREAEERREKPVKLKIKAGGQREQPKRKRKRKR